LVIFSGTHGLSLEAFTPWGFNLEQGVSLAVLALPYLLGETIAITGNLETDLLSSPLSSIFWNLVCLAISRPVLDILIFDLSVFLLELLVELGALGILVDSPGGLLVIALLSRDGGEEGGNNSVFHLKFLFINDIF
jgi:hypothetical protein